jgi:hypothetical protein
LLTLYARKRQQGFQKPSAAGVTPNVEHDSTSQLQIKCDAARALRQVTASLRGCIEQQQHMTG